MNFQSYSLGPNDGGIKRGDRADTGDDQADLIDGVGRGGSGWGKGPGATADPSAGEGAPGNSGTPGNEDDLNILDENDPDLGTTHKEDYY